MAGIVGVLSFYRQKVALAPLSPLYIRIPTNNKEMEIFQCLHFLKKLFVLPLEIAQADVSRAFHDIWRLIPN